MARPTKDQAFMAMAYVAAGRSHDPETRHGAVIVNAQDHIIATGYNGYPKGAPDHLLPDTRPGKYAWIVHAEANALVNCERSAAGARMYVTGMPCCNCMGAIINAGIRKVIIGLTRSAMVDEAMESIVSEMARHCGVEILMEHVPAAELVRQALSGGRK